MFVQRISALAGGLVLLAGGLTGGTAQAAVSESTSSAGLVAVSITKAHNVVMPTTIQPGVNQFRVTTEAKLGLPAGPAGSRLHARPGHLRHRERSHRAG